MSQHLELFAALAAPFEPDEVRVRPQGGRQLQYITARTVMNRLDDVLGPENWWDEYLPQENSVICRLTHPPARRHDADQVGRRRLRGHVRLGRRRQERLLRRLQARGRQVRRRPLPLSRRRASLRPGAGPAPVASRPTPAPGRSAARRRRRSAALPAARPGADDQGNGPPQTGKALFAWIKQQEEKLGPGLLKIISDWGQAA